MVHPDQSDSFLLVQLKPRFTTWRPEPISPVWERPYRAINIVTRWSSVPGGRFGAP